MTNQFRACLSKAEEDVLETNLNRYVSSARFSRSISCASCSRKANLAARNADYDCLGFWRLRLVQWQVEGKNDWSTSANVCLELLGRADFRALPVELQNPNLAKLSVGSALHALAVSVVEDRLTNGPQYKDSFGLLLSPLPAHHRLYYRRAKKGYGVLYDSAALVSLVLPQWRTYPIALGPVQHGRKMFRSISVLVPESELTGVVEARLRG
jgi:hypothetical protein